MTDFFSPSRGVTLWLSCFLGSVLGGHFSASGSIHWLRRLSWPSIRDCCQDAFSSFLFPQSWTSLWQQQATPEPCVAGALTSTSERVNMWKTFPPWTSFLCVSYCLFYRYSISMFLWLPIHFPVLSPPSQPWRALILERILWGWRAPRNLSPTLSIISHLFFSAFITRPLLPISRIWLCLCLSPSSGTPVFRWGLSVNCK